MFEKILAAVDESDIAERVLAAARALAALSHGEIYVIHLHEREPPKSMTPPIETPVRRALVDDAVQKLADPSVKATGLMRESVFCHAARQIIAQAKNRDADAIVMGSRGHGDLAGLLIGSTKHKVIHLADRPVLVVR